MEVNRVVALLTQLGENYPGAVSTMTIDYPQRQVLQRYKADAADAELFAEAVARLDRGAVSVQLEAVTYSLDELEDVTSGLHENPHVAERIFGAAPQDIGFNDHGLVVTLPKGAAQPHGSAETVLGVPAAVTVATDDAPADDEWQSSHVNASP